MLNLQHPDTLRDWEALKAIKRGGRQAADDQAMEAMWEALDRGASREEAEAIFNNTYQQFLNKKP